MKCFHINIVFAFCLMIRTQILWAADLEFDVSGYSDSGYVYGVVEGSEDSKDVDGHLITEEKKEIYFEGEWSGEGEIEGFDENGNYIELSID